MSFSPSHFYMQCSIAIYSKEELYTNFPIKETPNGIEVTFTNPKNQGLTLVVIYKSPNKPVNELCKRLQHVHNTYICDNIIIGDFNVNWNEDSSNKQKLSELRN